MIPSLAAPFQVPVLAPQRFFGFRSSLTPLAPGCGHTTASPGPLIFRGEHLSAVADLQVASTPLFGFLVSSVICEVNSLYSVLSVERPRVVSVLLTGL